MATDKPILNFVIDHEILLAIDDFRFRGRFPTRAAAVKWLLRWALNRRPLPPPQNAQNLEWLSELREMIAAVESKNLKSNEARNSLQTAKQFLSKAEEGFGDLDPEALTAAIIEGAGWTHWAEVDEAHDRVRRERIRAELEKYL